mmetsp:Transcript_19816/g.76055  ORF Transcript_19816/g.76055 Transcript_19816/m.76055 type:complete len:200 (-) Transcript_19816:1090-1689(-)
MGLQVRRPRRARGEPQAGALSRPDHGEALRAVGQEVGGADGSGRLVVLLVRRRRVGRGDGAPGPGLGAADRDCGKRPPPERLGRLPAPAAGRDQALSAAALRHRRVPQHGRSQHRHHARRPGHGEREEGVHRELGLEPGGAEQAQEGEPRQPPESQQPQPVGAGHAEGRPEALPQGPEEHHDEEDDGLGKRGRPSEGVD